ncbi:hypothetical protein ACQPZJ_29935 [Actinoplanes sp. CA-054009]
MLKVVGIAPLPGADGPGKADDVTGEVFTYFVVVILDWKRNVEVRDRAGVRR